MSYSDTEADQPASHRVGIIKTVQTPLGFFVLVVLVVEVVLGAVAGVSESRTSMITVVGMLLIIAALIGVVAYLAYARPEALAGKRPEPEPAVDSDEPTPEIVSPTKVFCATTSEFEGLGFSGDVSVVQQWYPIGMTVERNLTAESLNQHMTESSYQIVHLLGYIDPTSGDFVFNRKTGERLSCDGLAALVQATGARLVFLATCDSVFLAAKLAPITNVIAAHGNVDADKLVSWERCFYRLLHQGRPLSEAYDVAGKTSELPIILHMKQNTVFVPGAEQAGAA